MATDQPYLTVAWSYLDHFTLTWTHSGTDIFGFFMEVWVTATAASVVSYQSYNTALRAYAVPPPASAPLADDTAYSARVTALSLSGHVQSRIATITNGHQVSHTFFDGPVSTWPEHDCGVVDFGGGNTRYLPSMEVTHISDYQLPADFLPATAIPLAVTAGVRFGSFPVETLTSPDHHRNVHVNLFARPDGYTPPWTVSPPYPPTSAVTGLHADTEWIGEPVFAGAYKTIDPIQTEFNFQSNYPDPLDPQTGLPWTRAHVLSYQWGWGWYTWSSYTAIADQAGLFVNPSPPPDLISRPVREVAADGRIGMFKAYVDYAFPPTYDDEPGPSPGPEPEPPPAPGYHLEARYIRRLRRAPHVNNENLRVFYRRFELDLERGQALASGQGSEPYVLLRLSRDGGQTWGEEMRMAAGKLGEYQARVLARRLGHSRDVVFEVVVSDPVAWSLVGAWLDLEPGTS